MAFCRFCCFILFIKAVLKSYKIFQLSVLLLLSSTKILYALSKCPGGHLFLHRGSERFQGGNIKKREIHRGQLIFHRGAKQKLCLKNAEIP